MSALAKKAAAVIIVIATMLGVNLSVSAQSTDASQALQSATIFVADHTTQWPSWKGTVLGAGLPLADVQGRQIAYVFPVIKSAEPVGRIVVGDSLYHYIVLEAGGAPMPSLTVSEIKTILATNLALNATDAEVSQPQRTMYLGYANFVPVYEVRGQVVAVSLYFKCASLLTNIVSQLTPPEQMTFSAAGASGSWAGYTSFNLPLVPSQNMEDPLIQPPQENNCGPTAGANIDEFYKKFRAYSSFNDWPVDEENLYNYMYTNQAWCVPWGGAHGTCPPNAGPGWANYAASLGYQFGTTFFGPAPSNLDDLAQDIVNFQPAMICWLGNNNWRPGIYHWCAITGFEPTQGNPSDMTIMFDDSWGGTSSADLSANNWAYYLSYVWPVGCAVSGDIVLQGGARPDSGKQIPLTVRVFNTGATWNDWVNNNYLSQCIVTTVKASANGGTEIGFSTPTLMNKEGTASLPAGTYDVAVKAGHTLANIYRNVAIPASGYNYDAEIKLNLGTLLEGDCNDSGVVNIQDFSILASAFMKVNGQPGYDPRADFDYSGQVTIRDFSLLALNYMKYGFQEVGSGGMAPESPLTLATVDLTLQPSTQTVQVGQTFNVTIQVAAGDQQVSGVDAFVDFDPAYLEVVSITNGTPLPSQLLNQYDNVAGTLNFSAGNTSSSPPSGTFTVGAIQFRAKAQTAGTALTFSQTGIRNTDAAYAGDSVLGSVTGATVVIQP